VPESRNTKVKPKKVGYKEYNENRESVKDEYDPSGHRMPVEEV
jgi:hypothetical protein